MQRKRPLGEPTASEKGLMSSLLWQLCHNVSQRLPFASKFEFPPHLNLVGLISF